ncbi:DUF732 domain-containing protein [Kineococcus rubinsiae]|uniref:DUF732 domain-containing protein n=1 Tax=Kineococcus rubinsiae TaxID=2609562 RepID=UPI001431AFB3|nr:DUF732 domain-containing protein [Kineococcus rubinsiae]NIZ89545.1 hypothetical protein [Kineococcus rubinsiae]
MPALTRTLVRAAAGLLALSALTACTTSQEDQQGPEERSTPLGSSPTPVGTGQTNTPSAPDEYPDESGYPSAPAVATPGAAQLATLVTALTSIDPALAADPARVAQQAQETCQDIADGKSDTQLVGNVTSRFTVPGGPEVTTEQGQRILDAARSACGG